MMPIIPQIGGQLAGSVVFQPALDAASSMLMAQLDIIKQLNSQQHMGVTPINLPSPDALIALWAKGYFGYKHNDDDRDKVKLFLDAMRRQGIGLGDAGWTDKIPGDRKDKLQKTWGTVLDGAFQKPGIREAFAAYNAGILDRDEFNKMLRQNAALMGDWEWLQVFYSQRLSMPELNEAYNRGQFTDAQYDSYLKFLQYSVPKDREIVKGFTKHIPGSSDIIRYAVRDAFNPTQVKALGLAEELDQNPDYMDWARASGLGEVTIRTPDGKEKKVNFAELEWYAHWVLPSPTQSYQFMHRFYSTSRYGPSPWLKHGDKFEMAELNNLLKANDYSPQFRKNLAGISYHTLNNVDIRRMRKDNIIKKEEVYHNFRAKGYADNEAHQLTEWVERGVTKGVTDKQKQVVQRTVSETYMIGAIDKDRAKQMLLDAQFTTEQVDVELNLADAKMKLSQLKESMKAIRGGFMFGSSDESETRQLLANLGLKQDKVGELLGVWNFLLVGKRRIINTGQLIRWFVSGIIDMANLVSRLTKLNYSPADLTRLVQEATLAKAETIAKAQKAAAKEMQASLEKDMAAAKKRRDALDRAQKEQQQVLEQHRKDVQRAETKRLERFLSARTEKNLAAWLADKSITESEVRDTLRMKGWIDDDITRWLTNNRKKK